MAETGFRPKEFATRLRERRTKNDWTQEQVAEWAGMDPTALSHFEAGRRLPSCENLFKLCQGLRCSADDLLGIEVW